MVESEEQLIQLLQMLQIQQQAEQAPIDFSPFSMQRMAGETAPVGNVNQGPAGSPGGTGENQAGYSGTGSSFGAAERAKEAGLAGVGKVGANAAKNAMTGGLMGFDPMQAATQGIRANPASVLGIGPAMGYAGAGIKGPGGFFGGLMNMAPKALAAALGLTGPLGATIGMLGTPFADAMGDYFGLRDLDDMRDDIEGELGQLGGRSAYADAMTGVNKSELDTLDASNPRSTFDAIGKTNARKGTSPQMTPANLEKNVQLIGLEKALQELQDRLSTRRDISSISNTGNSSTSNPSSMGGYSGIGGIGDTSRGGMSAGFGSGRSSPGLSGTLGDTETGYGSRGQFGDVSLGDVDFGGGGNNGGNDSGNGGDGSTGQAGGPDSDNESTGF